MQITWYGHSCFLIESADGSVVIDPYAPGSVPGLAMPRLTADVVLCSHGHTDHAYREGVALTGRAYGGTIRKLETFHDEEQGKRRGTNSVLILETEGKRIVHMGDIGHSLSSEAVSALGSVAALLIPVGGYYTVNASAAKAIADAVDPEIIIPMHYRSGDKGLSQIAEVSDFTALFPKESVRFLTERTVDLTEATGGKVFVFPWPEA